jgi:GAF domain-containing protein
MNISQTILDYVMQHKEGVLTSDAREDQRWDTAASILQQGVREAICVPMKGRHETVGVLYLDTQSSTKEILERGAPTGKFTEDHLSLAIALGHQAALAVEETRRHVDAVDRVAHVVAQPAGLLLPAQPVGRCRGQFSRPLRPSLVMEEVREDIRGQVRDDRERSNREHEHERIVPARRHVETRHCQSSEQQRAQYRRVGSQAIQGFFEQRDLIHVAVILNNGIRTIVWDKETQVYEIFKYAILGAPSSNPPH